MNILDLVFGKPLKTTNEHPEQVGPAQGIPIFGLHPLHSAPCVPRPPPTLSLRRWLLYRGALQPWSTYQLACRCRAPRRLHSHGRRGHFRGSRCISLGRSVLAATYGFSLRGHTDRHHHPQSPGRARSRRCFRGSYLSVCWHTSHNHRRRCSSCSAQRRASHTGSSASASAAHDGSRQLLAAAEGFRQRLHGVDWRGSCEQRREGFPGAHREKRSAHSHRDYFSISGSLGRGISFLLKILVFWFPARRYRLSPSFLPPLPPPL